MTERIDASRRNVRKFGILFGILGALLAAYMIYRGSGHWYWPAGASLFFFLSGVAAYPVLKPLYIGWMTFAFALGWVNTRLLLGIFFYIILTPIGLILRLTGKDLLDKRIDRKAPSYWKKRDRTATDRSQYERLF